MGYDDRIEFTKGLKDEVVDWSPLNTSIGFAASSAITGNPFSVEGSGMAVGITYGLEALNFIFDGAAESIAQMWIPAEVDGNKITSEDMAQTVAYEQTVSVLEGVVAKFGYELRYTTTKSIKDFAKGTGGAREFQHYFDAVVTNATRAAFNANKPYPYAPERLLFLIADNPYKKIEKNDPLTTLVLGFEPAYESLHKGATIAIFGGVKKDADGEPVPLKIKSVEYAVDDANKHMWMTSLGRDMYRQISSQLPWVQGKDEFNQRAIMVGGEAYTFFSTSAKGFINGRFNN